MQRLKTAFTEAAAELASQVRGTREMAEVEIYEAREAVDADVIVSWIAHQTLGREDESILADAMALRLTNPDARSVLCAIAIDHDAKIAELVKFAVREQVARDLMYAANCLLEQYDPTDAEMSRDFFPAEVDDPIIGDRRALARSYR